MFKRLHHGRVEANEYEVLESIDRFCALVMEMLQMVPRNKEQAILHGQLIDRYWLNKIKERVLFRQYVEQFWPLMGDALVKLPENSGFTMQSRSAAQPSGGNETSLSQRQPRPQLDACEVEQEASRLALLCGLLSKY